jgi:hypothetical protein
VPYVTRSPTLARAFTVIAPLLTIALAPAAARAQLTVLTNLVEERTARPGDQYTGMITIGNSSGQTQAVRVYQTDFRFAADGTSNTDDPGTSARSNATWIHPQVTRLSIPAGTEVNLPYTVNVPVADSLRGTYWSAVMIEGAPTSPAVAALTSAGRARAGVGSVMRYAIQLATHIGATGSRAVQFSNVNASQSPDSGSAVQLDVTNVGERGFRPTLWIEVYDSDGALRAKGKQVRGLLYPGTSLRQRFELGRFPRGSYKAVIFADTGSEPVFAAQFAVVF